MTSTKAHKKRSKAARTAKVRSKRGLPAIRPRVVTRTKIVREKAPKAPQLSVGQQIGMHLGGAAQKVFKAMTGFGDYKVQGNSIMGGDPPVIKNGPNATIIRHREYVCDINASTAFTLQSFALNPGLINIFPWLSSVADSYEEYKFRGVVFEYKAMSADNILSSSTSTALGTVIMATEYNVLLPNFTDKRSMENYEFANSARPSRSFYHPIECKDSLDVSTHRYIRIANKPLLGDNRLYDLGNFQIAVQGCQSSTGVIGELWVTYEIEFYKPRITPSLTTGVDSFNVTNCSTTAVTGTTLSVARNSIGGTLNQSTNTYTFPPNTTGRFYVTIYCYNSAASSNNYVVCSTTNGCGLIPILGVVAAPNQSYVILNNGNGMGYTSFMLQVAPVGNGSLSSFALTGNTTGVPASNSQLEIIITSVDYGTLTGW